MYGNDIQFGKFSNGELLNSFVWGYIGMFFNFFIANHWENGNNAITILATEIK